MSSFLRLRPSTIRKLCRMQFTTAIELRDAQNDRFSPLKYTNGGYKYELVTKGTARMISVGNPMTTITTAFLPARRVSFLCLLFIKWHAKPIYTIISTNCEALLSSAFLGQEKCLFDVCSLLRRIQNPSTSSTVKGKTLKTGSFFRAEEYFFLETASSKLPCPSSTHLLLMSRSDMVATGALLKARCIFFWDHLWGMPSRVRSTIRYFLLLSRGKMLVMVRFYRKGKFFFDVFSLLKVM